MRLVDISQVQSAGMALHTLPSVTQTGQQKIAITS